MKNFNRYSTILLVCITVLLILVVAGLALLVLKGRDNQQSTKDNTTQIQDATTEGTTDTQETSTDEATIQEKEEDVPVTQSFSITRETSSNTYNLTYTFITQKGWEVQTKTRTKGYSWEALEPGKTCTYYHIKSDTSNTYIKLVPLCGSYAGSDEPQYTLRSDAVRLNFDKVPFANDSSISTIAREYDPDTNKVTYYFDHGDNLYSRVGGFIDSGSETGVFLYAEGEIDPNQNIDQELARLDKVVTSFQLSKVN